MNERQIGKVLKAELGSNFVGVFPADKLFMIRRNTPRPFAVVVNTDPSDMPGTHWVAIYIRQYGVEYFDSLGRPPNNHFRSFLQRFSRHCAWNEHQYQSIVSSLCGAYCILFIITRHTHPTLSMHNILRKLFKRGYWDFNDRIVQVFMMKRYALYLPITDVDFVREHIGV